jgi:hypothetical protein
MLTMRVAFAITSLLVSTRCLAQSRQETAMTNAETKVLSFEGMRYPVLAYHARIQGLVPIQVKLDDQGRVIDATAISGPSLLAAPSVENVKKWLFGPNGSKSTVIVYRYKILKGTCDDESQLFVLQESNVATVFACPPLVNPSSSQRVRHP